MKASVFIAIYNKRDELHNCLYSISKQVVDFPIEYCFVDDCSDEDPLPIIKKFLSNSDVKYKRLSKHVGFIYAQSECFNLMSSDSDIIILQSADVIITRSNCYSILCREVKDKIITLSCVVDIPVDKYLWKSNYDETINKITENWEEYITRIDLNIDGNTYKNCSTLYSGRPECSWLFFCGAIKTKDLIDLGYIEGGCDAMLHSKMKSMRYGAKLFPLMKVIHQRHVKKTPLCPIINKCKIHCIRKSQLTTILK
jgi:glycosyltransferase involved in cell wall biosynthesis